MSQDPEVLSKSPLFVGLPGEQMKALEEAAVMGTYSDGEVVVEEGTPSDCIFVLQEGATVVEKRDPGGRPILLAALSQPGDFFGEMSLVDVLPRSTTVRSKGPSVIWALHKKVLVDFFREYPEAQLGIVLNMARELSTRLRRANDTIVALVSTRKGER